MFINKDYDDFVARMGSFDDTLDFTDDSNNEIKHYGVLGMKWGHRKGIDSNVIGAAARTGQSVASLGQTVTKSSYNKKALKDAKSLTDDELKQITARLELENRYMNATTQQSGKSKVEGILSTAGAALAVVSSAAITYDAIRRARGL